MKRQDAVASLLLALLVTMPGCFTVPMAAPHGPDVSILPRGVPVEVSRRYQKWYAIWGIFELSATSDPRAIIDEEELVEVRIYTEDSIEDAISGFFYVLLFPAGIIVPQTIVVEGNRARRPADAEPTGP